MFPIPPTPTAIHNLTGEFSGPGSHLPQIHFPSIWTLAPEAVQTWNNFGTATTVMQAMILAGVVGLGIYMLYRYFRRITADNTDAD